MIFNRLLYPIYILLVETVISVEQALLVICRELAMRSQRFVNGIAHLIVSVSSGDDTASIDRKRFSEGHMMSVKSSRGLRRIESSFNKTISEDFVNENVKRNSDTNEKIPEFNENRHQNGARGYTESNHTETKSWNSQRSLGPVEGSGLSKFITMTNWIQHDATISIFVRVCITFLLSIYTATLDLTERARSFSHFVLFNRRNKIVDSSIVPSKTSNFTEQELKKIVTSEDLHVESIHVKDFMNREEFANDGERLKGTLDQDLMPGLPRSSQHRQQRIGVIEELTDLYELLFTRLSSWMNNYFNSSHVETLKSNINKHSSESKTHSTDKEDHLQQILDQDILDHRIDYDDRTVADMIREAGYPCDVHNILTPDGYYLQLFRIPRRNAEKGAVLFLHGVYDSAMAFISGGLCSQPYVSYDHGFDVWLGNLRICSPWRKVDGSKHAAAYWDFSINELAIYDCRSFVEYIEKARSLEFSSQCNWNNGDEIRTGNAIRNGKQYLTADEYFVLKQEEVNNERQENKRKSLSSLQIVAHSLGGSVALLYLVWFQRKKIKENLREEFNKQQVSRLVLLSPAGFHHHQPPAAVYLFIVVDCLFGFLFRRINFGVYLPTRVGRLLLHRLMQDILNMPALISLVNLVVGKISLSDSSDFARALHLPHLNPDAMVGCSYKLCLSLYRCYKQKRFISFDNYGDVGKNREHFFSDGAIDVAGNYNLIKIPIDITAGTRDGVIRPENILCHYRQMLKSGVDVSYREFESGHLDFRASESRELRKYVLELLLENK